MIIRIKFCDPPKAHQIPLNTSHFLVKQFLLEKSLNTQGLTFEWVYIDNHYYRNAIPYQLIYIFNVDYAIIIYLNDTICCTFYVSYMIDMKRTTYDISYLLKTYFFSFEKKNYKPLKMLIFL